MERTWPQIRARASQWAGGWCPGAIATGLLAILALLLGASGGARADESLVPPRLEASLVSKIAGYDRGLPARAENKVLIAIVSDPDDVDSAKGAAQLHAAMGDLETVAGLPHEEFAVRWQNAAALREMCDLRHPAIIYFAVGLGDSVTAIATALDGVSVLTVGGLPSYVAKGVVLGFDLVGGQPKIVINLAQARRQKINFDSALLRLARVIE